VEFFGGRRQQYYHEQLHLHLQCRASQMEWRVSLLVLLLLFLSQLCHAALCKTGKQHLVSGPFLKTQLASSSHLVSERFDVEYLSTHTRRFSKYSEIFPSSLLCCFQQVVPTTKLFLNSIDKPNSNISRLGMSFVGTSI